MNSKLESANKFALKTLLDLGNNLERRRYYSSLASLYNCMNSNGPRYIKNFFQFRYTKYNSRSSGNNL